MGLQGAIFLLDAGTLWSMLCALGLSVPPALVFASFVLSTLARTLAPVPGGLGIFEAASVATLKLAAGRHELKAAGLGILITDHSVRETLAIVDRAYLICEGKVLREGTSQFLIDDPVSRELYLGPRFSM